MKKYLKRLENETEQNVDEQLEEQGIKESDFMQMIMDEINSKTLNIMGEFNDEMVAFVREFASKLWYYEADTSRPLYINITSHGGYLNALMAILDILQDLKEEWDCTIITNCTGYAESCGFILWCFGDKRCMGKYGELMTHYIKYNWQGTPEDHEKELKRTKRMQDKVDEIICEKTSLTKKQLRAWYKKGDTFIDYKKAKELGLLTIGEEEKPNE